MELTIAVADLTGEVFKIKRGGGSTIGKESFQTQNCIKDSIFLEQGQGGGLPADPGSAIGLVLAGGHGETQGDAKNFKGIWARLKERFEHLTQSWIYVMFENKFSSKLCSL